MRGDDRVVRRLGRRSAGGLGTPLADGNWPGFTRRFLQSIDAAMTIRPTERPQSISDWFAMFGKKGVEEVVGSEEEPTRFFAHEVATEEITPVAPPPSSSKTKVPLETRVPAKPSDAQFKAAGQETKGSKKAAPTADGDAAPVAAAAVALAAEPAAPPKPAVVAKSVSAKSADKTSSEKPRFGVVAGASAALLVAVAAGALIFGRGGLPGTGDGATPISIPSEATPAAVGIIDVGGLAPATRALADDARKAGAPTAAIDGLNAAGTQLDTQSQGLQALLNDPAQATAATARADEMKRIAIAANVAIANALLQDADARMGRVPSGVPSSTAAGLQGQIASLRSAVEAATNATDPGQSLAAARNALAQSQSLSGNLRLASRAVTETAAAQAPKKIVTVEVPRVRPTEAFPTAPTVVATPVAVASTVGVSPAKARQFSAVVSEARGMAQRVIAMGGRGGDDAGAKTRRDNAALARNYDKYLATLKDSMRGAKNDRDADRLIKQANQTKAYISFLTKQSAQ